MNKEADAILDLAAKVLDWNRKEVDGFSLRMIREMVRNRDHPDAKKLIKAIDWGLDPSNPHPLWLGDPEK